MTQNLFSADNFLPDLPKLIRLREYEVVMDCLWPSFFLIAWRGQVIMKDEFF